MSEDVTRLEQWELHGQIGWRLREITVMADRRRRSSN